MRMYQEGDRVVRNGLYCVPEKDRGVVFTVRGFPWKLGDGTMVVSLHGKAGGFPTDGLSPAPEEPEEEGTAPRPGTDEAL